MVRRLALVTAALLAWPAGVARADTVCTMGSPTPGFNAIRLDLPQGSSYLGIELHGDRATRPIEDGSSWHFARGIVLLDSYFDLVSYRLKHSGSSPKNVVVDASGQRVSQAVPGVDGPFIHSTSSIVARLSPGTYYAVGFGVDGSAVNPNEYWTADVRVQGVVSCAGVATGETIDVNHTEGDAEMQAYVPSAGIAMGGALQHSSPRQVSVGLIDCSVQFAVEGATSASCDAAYPDGSAIAIEDAIVPFVTGPGTTSVMFDHAGLAPVVAIAGATFDLNV